MTTQHAHRLKSITRAAFILGNLGLLAIVFHIGSTDGNWDLPWTDFKGLLC